MRLGEEILSADLKVLLSSVVWLTQRSRAETDDLQSFFQLGGMAMLSHCGPGKVLDLAGRAGWRWRSPLRGDGCLCLLGSVCIRKALGNPGGTKESLKSL